MATLHGHSPRPLSTSRPLSMSPLHVPSPHPVSTARPLSTSPLDGQSRLRVPSRVHSVHSIRSCRAPPCCPPEPSRSSAHVTVPPSRMPTISQTKMCKGAPELQVVPEPELPRLSNISALQHWPIRSDIANVSTIPSPARSTYSAFRAARRLRHTGSCPTVAALSAAMTTWTSPIPLEEPLHPMNPVFPSAVTCPKKRKLHFRASDVFPILIRC